MYYRLTWNQEEWARRGEVGVWGGPMNDPFAVWHFSWEVWGTYYVAIPKRASLRKRGVPNRGLHNDSRFVQHHYSCILKDFTVVSLKSFWRALILRQNIWLGQKASKCSGALCKDFIVTISKLFLSKTFLWGKNIIMEHAIFIHMYTQFIILSSKC